MAIEYLKDKTIITRQEAVSTYKNKWLAIIIVTKEPSKPYTDKVIIHAIADTQKEIYSIPIKIDEEHILSVIPGEGALGERIGRYKVTS